MAELDCKDTESMADHRLGTCDHITQQGDSDLSNSGGDHRECILSRSADMGGSSSSVHGELVDSRTFVRYSVSSSMLSQLDHQHLGQHHSDHVSSPKNEIHHAISAPPVTSHDSNDGLTQAESINHSVCVSDNGRDLDNSSISVSDHDQFHSCDQKGHNGLGSVSSGHHQHSFHHLSNSFISGAGNIHQQGADNGMHLGQSLPPEGVMGQSRLVEVGCNGSYNQQSPWQTIPTSGNGISLPPGYLDGQLGSPQGWELRGKAEDRMNPERLGQLQHYIGSAREKQERWKSRVQGGNLFKKNQEKSFLDALIMWHGEGIILLHRLPGAEDPGRSSGADEPRPSHRPPGGHHDALSSVDSLLEPEPGPKRRAVDGPDGPIPVCDPDGGLGGVSDGGGGRGGGGHEGMLGGLRDHGDGVRLGMHDGLLGGGGRDGMDAGMGMHEGVGGEGFKACMVAASNVNAHPHSYQITGWSVISLPKWDLVKRRWFTGDDTSEYKPGSFNMCLRHMGFRPTKGARYGGNGFDWDNSVGWIFDPDVRAKYASRRSKKPAPT